MKDKVFIETDVILDVVFERKPHFYNSQKILSIIENNFISGFTSSLILANCYYIISSNKDEKTARKTIAKLRSIITILPFTDKEIGESLNSGFKDFEDGVQFYIASNNNIKIIITRNIGDFKKSEINIIMPGDYLNLERTRKLLKN